MQGKSLHIDQIRAAALIGRGESHTDAAAEVGVIRETIDTWAKIPEFIEAVDISRSVEKADGGRSSEARRKYSRAISNPAVQKKAEKALEAAVYPAVGVLVKLLDSKSEGRRMEAAKFILSNSTLMGGQGGKDRPSVMVQVNTNQLRALEDGMAEMDKEVRLHEVKAGWDEEVVAS